MKRPQISFIAQFPPPIHGLSKAVETLYDSSLNRVFLFSKIDITSNRSIFKNLWKILFDESDLYYFTISQTKGGNWRDLLILKLLQWKKRKCLIHLHGGYYRVLIDEKCGKLQRRLNYHAIKNLSGCIVLGNSLRKIFQGMSADEKIYVVPNCVDNQYMLSLVFKEKKIIDMMSMDRVEILYLSNFIPTKGYREVLHLAYLTKKNNCTWMHFNFAGKFFDMEEEKYFRDYVAEYRLDEYVTYHGIVSGKRKNDLLRKCNLFILLTNYPNEGQPISILEAMGNAMAIVTTNHAGIPDIVKDKVNGLVVDKTQIDITGIYNYIEQLWKNRQMFQQVCQTNYLLVREKYTEQQYIKNMERIFNQVLNH